MGLMAASIQLLRKSSTFRAFSSVKRFRSDLSYARSMFFGSVNEKQAFPYPDVLTEDERETAAMLVQPVEKFFDEKVDSFKIDREAKIPDDVMTGLKELGLFGLQIPTELGGLGLSNSAYARVAEEVCRDGSIAVTLLAHQSIGLKGILLNGNDAQKEQYLPKLATGEHVAAFALTEEGSGSDAGSIKTKATLNEAGTHYLLNGQKIWISNGGIADVFTVFAKTEVDGEEKVTAFIVERSFGGLENDQPEDKLGIRGSNTCVVRFEDCPVPVENVLGEVGGGFKVAMNILNNGRFGLGAGAASQIRNMIQHVAEHATSRKQFGQPIGNFGLIREKFAQMTLDAYACEAMAYMTTGMIDRGDPECYVEAAMCKVAGSEAAFRSISECIQIMGGTGFMKNYPYELGLRDARILSIFEGTNEILRLLIALTGIKGVGDHLKNVQKSLKNPLGNPNLLMSEVSKRMKRFTSDVALPGKSASSGDAISSVHSELKEQSKILSHDVEQFGQAVESMIIKHKKDIINQQIVLKRIANMAIDLFATTAVLSRASRSMFENSEHCQHEAKLAKAWCQQAHERISSNLSDLKSKTPHDDLLNSIAEDVLKHKSYLPEHPLRI